MAENLVFYAGFEAPWHPTMAPLRHPWQKTSCFTTVLKPRQTLESRHWGHMAEKHVFYDTFEALVRPRAPEGYIDLYIYIYIYIYIRRPPLWGHQAAREVLVDLKPSPVQ